MYYLLIDIDINEYKKHIRDFRAIINNNVIKFSTLSKLYFYLKFKTNDKAGLKKLIEDEIRNLELSLDNSTTDVKIHRIKEGIERKIKQQENKIQIQKK